MLTVTDSAGQYLNQILSSEQTPDDAAVRLVAEGRGIAVRLDSERPGDATFEHEGRTVLVLDGPMSQLLQNSTLDVETTPEGPSLTLNPGESGGGGEEPEE